jgi:CheY-like chemotaxis protein
MAGAPLLHDVELADVNAWIGDPSPPCAVLLDLRDKAFSRRVFEVRAHFASRYVPIIAVTDEVRDLAFEEAFASGVEDVSPLEARALGKRLRRVADVDPFALERKNSTVLVVEDDHASRILVGQVFEFAGYKVAYARDPNEALARVVDGDVRIVVAGAATIRALDDADPVWAQAARAGSTAPWIICTPPRDIGRVRDRLVGGAPVAAVAHDAFSSPATLLFVANELIHRPPVDGRLSERLLYGASVRFQLDGRPDQEMGYLYNVSAGGVYVRSLVPPEAGSEIWLEFVPPRSDLAVRLEGTVAWARSYGPARAATHPVGFGVKIEGGSRKSLTRFARSYNVYLAERVALRRREVKPGERPSKRPTLPAVPGALLTGTAVTIRSGV